MLYAIPGLVPCHSFRYSAANESIDRLTPSGGMGLNDLFSAFGNREVDTVIGFCNKLICGPLLGF